MDAQNTAVGGKLGQPRFAGQMFGFENTAVLFINHMRPVEFIDNNLGKTAISNKDGDLVIKNLPAGTWELQLWQEKVGYLANVTVDGEKVEWKRGRLKITVEEGKTTDLGVVKFK